MTDLLDYLVYRATLESVPIEKEVQLLENYIGLEQLRYGDHLKLNINLKGVTNGVMVAPLILLPFAENCFKHGGPSKDGDFTIQLYLKADQNRLRFSLQNTKKRRPDESTATGGVGLQNLRERLQLIYPDQHELVITDSADAYLIELMIKLNANGKI